MYKEVKKLRDKRKDRPKDASSHSAKKTMVAGRRLRWELLIMALQHGSVGAEIHFNETSTESRCGEKCAYE